MLHAVKWSSTLYGMYESPNLNLQVLLTKEEEAALERVGSIARYPAGSILMGELERTSFVLLIKSGHAKVVLERFNRIVGIRGPGEIIGEMAAIRNRPRSASVYALNDVQTLYLPGPRWLDFLVSHSRVALALLYLTEERLDEATRKSVESLLGAQQKLAKALLELESNGLGSKGPEGSILRFAQADLANIAGISIDSAKQGVRLFKAQGIIKVGRQSVTIRDLAQIEAIARGDSTASL